METRRKSSVCEFSEATIVVDWNLSKASLEDKARDHFRDAQDFQMQVEMLLSNSTVAVRRVSNSSTSLPQVIRFRATLPIPRADWMAAIAAAAKSCCVLTDQRTWSFSA